MQVILASDLEALHYDSNSYSAGVVGEVELTVAGGGSISRDMIQLEIRLMHDDRSEPLGRWFLAMAVIDNMVDTRLSGLEMREIFYFATTPGNQALYVSSSKAGIIAKLLGS